MTDHSQQAFDLFKQGYNCAQSVFAAFCDEIGMDFATALKISSSFGAGMGRMREVCGAVSAMFMVAGLKFGYTDPQDQQTKAEHYKLIQELANQFKKTNNTIICRELLGLNENDQSYIPEQRTEEYYNNRPCADFVKQAAEILDNYIKNKNLEERKMKIAVASEGSMVTGHFGHCEHFNVYDTENNQIINASTVANPGHRPGFLPNFLGDLGVNVIISGGMGGGAVDIFNERGIEVITGASGDAMKAVESYLKGELKSTGSICHEHMHHDECGR